MSEWFGDLNDDCHAVIGDWHLHVEQLDTKCVWFVVYGPDGKEYNSSNDGFMLPTMKLGRKAAEVIYGILTHD